MQGQEPVMGILRPRSQQMNQQLKPLILHVREPFHLHNLKLNLSESGDRKHCAWIGTKYSCKMVNYQH